MSLRLPKRLLLILGVLLALPALGFTLPAGSALAGPALTVNAATGQHAISPDIYGLNFPDPSLAANIDLPLARWGGNATTRYNWQLDISNRASDWFFENIDNDNARPENLPNGSASDQFVDQNRATGSDSLLTVPLIGYTPKVPRDANPRNCGYSTALLASQESVAPDAPCGNGQWSNGTPIPGQQPAQQQPGHRPRVCGELDQPPRRPLWPGRRGRGALLRLGQRNCSDRCPGAGMKIGLRDLLLDSLIISSL